MAEILSDTGYVLIFISCALVLGLYVPWLNPKKKDEKGLPAEGTHPELQMSDVQPAAACSVRTYSAPSGLTMKAHASVGLIGTLLAAVGNVMTYRVVLREHLAGTVVERRGAAAVVTTLAIVASLLYLFGFHCALLGAGTVPQAPRRAALSAVAAIAVTLLIIVAKLCMGIVHYEEPCYQGSAPPTMPPSVPAES